MTSRSIFSAAPAPNAPGQGQHGVTAALQLFENQLLTYTQAAQYLGITPQYLRELKAAREIKAVEIGPRCVRFRVASLNQFILEREVS